MPPEASGGVQGNEAEMVPAGPDPQQQQKRDVTAHQDYSKEDEEDEEARAPAEIEEFKRLLPMRKRILKQLHVRISELLGRDRVVATGDAGRRCLDFIKTELDIIAALTTPLSRKQGTALWDVRGSADRVLREVDPSRHMLLRRASQCFRRRNSYLLDHTLRIYYIIENSSRYRHLLNLGLTAQLAKPEAKPMPKPEPEPERGALPLLGMDHLTKKILWWLALPHQGKNMRIRSIVGPAGIGKTTLAVEVRNQLKKHETLAVELRYCFQCNVMAQASRGTDRNIRLLKDILSQVSPGAEAGWSSDNPSLELRVNFVSMNLQHKRYFLIIDDLWEASDWEKIKGAFPNNNLGSRILVTTRSTSTARACCDSYDGLVHEMKPLSEMNSERLLLAKAVGSVDGCLPNNMKLHCDELRRCDGIPFFIIGMAEWLKERLQQQQQQQHMPLKYLERASSSAFNDFRDDVLRLLLCYMSMLPYGYKFEKDRLILKWIHEGLIDHTAEAKSEAERLFSQLVDRNIIASVASNCKNKQDEAEACQWQVNHFIQQSLASKSSEMGFIFTTTTHNLLEGTASAHCSNQTSSRMPRRLAFHHPDPGLSTLLEKMNLSQTRSLAVSGTVCRIPLDKFVNLVVLNLEGWENFKDEDLLQVCRSKMFFLTYLSVKNTPVHKLPHEIKELQTLLTLDVSYTLMTVLPHEIKELRTLQTLDISYTQISELPLELFKLTCLQYLDLRGTRISQLPKQLVGLRDNLSHLLVGGQGTINSVETAMPHDVRHLSKLQTLATVDLTQHPASFIRALGDLHSLEVLAVTWSFHQSTDRDCCEALRLSIGKWERLKSLIIHCGPSCCSMEFLGDLGEFPGPQALKQFKVTAGRFTSVPPWIHKLEHLAFVEITICTKQATDDLKIFGALPKLQCLILGLDFIPGQPIVIGNEGFYELQRFSLDCPMPWLTFSIEAMLNLTYLQLKFCSTPTIADHVCVPSGISNLHRLTEVSLCYNAQYINSPSVKMTVEAVTKEVVEHHNPIDLFINGIEQDDAQEADDEVTENTTGTSSRINAGAEDHDEAAGEETTEAIQSEISEAKS